MTCRACDAELTVAREWAVIVEQRKSALDSAKARLGEARARAADHAAAHPFREA